MNISALITQYGYFALFAGALIEGETVLLLAGFAAHQGYLQLHWVMLVALLGGFTGDQLYFWLGRRHGAWVLCRFPRMVPLFERANTLIARYHELIIVGMRFAYGLRTVGPIALGMSAVAGWRFLLFNALGASIWAVAIGGAGYLFGHALELLLADIKKIELALLFAMMLAGIALLFWRRWRFRRKWK